METDYHDARIFSKVYHESCWNYCANLDLVVFEENITENWQVFEQQC